MGVMADASSTAPTSADRSRRFQGARLRYSLNTCSGSRCTAPAPAPAPAPTPVTPGALPARATSRSRERRPAAASRRGAATRTSRATPAFLPSPECRVLSAAARSAAIANGFRSRVVLAADSLRIDRWTGSSWEPYLRWTGPSELGVELTVSNPEVVFGPTGTGWGPSNTEAVLRSRSRHARITVSRVGRVKRWL